jgi:hypothetical protein
VAAAWPAGISARAIRLAVVVWIGAVFSEFMGPFNVLHQPLRLSVVAWAFWAVPALAEAFAIVTVIERQPRTAGAVPETADREGSVQRLQSPRA